MRLDRWYAPQCDNTIIINNKTINKTYINIFIASILDPHYKNLVFNSWELDINSNPLDFYSKNYKKYSILNILAKNYLSISATSVPSESIFSISNSIKTKPRNALKSDTFRDIVSLKSWDFIKKEDYLEPLYIKVTLPINLELESSKKS